MSGGIRAVFFDFYGVLEDYGRPNEPVVELARRLQETYKVGVLSNASVRLEARLQNGWGAIERFDAVITSGRTGLEKPFKPIYLYAAKALDLPPEACVHVDDSPGHVEGARRAGLHAIFYTGDTSALERELRELGLAW